jgi:hypothetical protein
VLVATHERGGGATRLGLVLGDASTVDAKRMPPKQEASGRVTRAPMKPTRSNARIGAVLAAAGIGGVGVLVVAIYALSAGPSEDAGAPPVSFVVAAEAGALDGGMDASMPLDAGALDAGPADAGTPDVRQGRDRRPEPRPTPPQAVPNGTVSIFTAPWGHISIDGRRIGRTAPARDLPVAAGRHTITLEHPDGMRAEQVVDVPPGGSISVQMPLQ